MKIWKIFYPTAFGMTIQLGNDHTAYIHAISEGQSLVIASLTNATVHNKYNILGCDGLRDLLHFIKKFLFLFVSSWSIYDDYFEVFFLEMVHAIQRDLYRIRFCVAPIERNSHFGGILLQLVEGPSSERIRTHQGHFPAFLLVVIGIFGTSRGLTRPLQADKHNHIGVTAFGHKRLVLALKQWSEFFDNRRLHHFS